MEVRCANSFSIPRLAELIAWTATAFNGVVSPNPIWIQPAPFRHAIISILATLAKQERIRLSERTKAGLERARKQVDDFDIPSDRDVLCGSSQCILDEVKMARSSDLCPPRHGWA
jgi:hypothetical protein